MYCRNCGEQIHDEAVICVKCGVSQKTKLEVIDNGGFSWGLLGCCLPVVGLILFLIWRDTKPVTAKSVGIGAIVSMCFVFLYYSLIFFMTFMGMTFGILGSVI